ncbi:hypothetical protein IGI67_003370 [Enterococcus sp. AZ196]
MPFLILIMLPVILIALAILFWGIFITVTGLVAGTSAVIIKNKKLKIFIIVTSSIFFFTGVIIVLPFSSNYLTFDVSFFLSVLVCILISIISIIGIYLSKQIILQKPLKIALIFVYILFLIFSLSYALYILFFLIKV